MGTPLLFLAALLPFSLLSVTAFGFPTTATAILIIPALAFWTVLALAIGAAIRLCRDPDSHSGSNNHHACGCTVGVGNDNHVHRYQMVIANCRALLFRKATAGAT
jgi:hypothetical protein